MTNKPQTTMTSLLERLNTAVRDLNANLICINMRHPRFDEEGNPQGSLQSVVTVGVAETVPLSTLIGAFAKQGIEMCNISDGINIIGEYNQWTMTVAPDKETDND